MKKEEKALPRNKVQIFKIRNRSGYAALYNNNLTEGSTMEQAYQRMVKAAKRKARK